MSDMYANSRSTTDTAVRKKDVNPTSGMCPICIKIMKENGMYVPDIAFAGGFVNETQIFKSMAMSDLGRGPTVKAIAMARASIAAVMKSTYFNELSKKNDLPPGFAKIYTSDPAKFMIAYSELEKKFGKDIKKMPPGAIGLYTYWHDRIGVGLQQLMAGARKFKLDCISRSDIASISERATRVTGIPMISDIESDLMSRILLEGSSTEVSVSAVSKKQQVAARSRIK